MCNMEESPPECWQTLWWFQQRRGISSGDSGNTGERNSLLGIAVNETAGAVLFLFLSIILNFLSQTEDALLKKTSHWVNVPSKVCSVKVYQVWMLRRHVGHLLDRLQGLCVFLLSLFDLSEAAAPDVDLHLLPHRQTAQEEEWLGEKLHIYLKV